MKSNFLSLWFTFLLLAYHSLSLHLTLHLSISAYIASLKTSYTALDPLIDELIQLSQASLTKATALSDIDQKIKAFDEAFQKENTDLVKVEQLLIKPINETDWGCSQQISSDEREKVNSLISTIQQKDINLIAAINNLTDISQNAPMAQALAEVSSQAQRISKDLYAVSNTPGTIGSPSEEYKTNILAQNWVLGNTTLKELEDSYAPNSNMVTHICPLDNPFYFDHKCQNCSGSPKLYFNVSEGKCRECIHFNPAVHQCQDIYGSNLEAAANRLVLPDSNSSVNLLNYQSDVECPANAPFWNKVTCINCPSPNQLFSLSTYTCTNCEDNQAYDNNTHRCVKQIRFFTRINDTGVVDTIVVGNETLASINQKQSNLSEKYRVVECSAETPFYNGSACIACSTEPDTLFNWTTQQCTHCESNEIYNASTHSCVKQIRLFTNLEEAINRLILPLGLNASSLSSQEAELKSKYNVVECPADKPFLSTSNNSNECIACNAGDFFDYSAKSCGQCPEHTYYDSESHHCITVPRYSNLTGTSWKLSAKNQSEVIAENKLASSKPHAEICPTSAPFYNGSECVTCSMGEQFDVEKLQCSKCGTDQYYSQTTHKCLEIAKIQGQTNPDIAPNLIYGNHSYNYWMKEYFGNLVANSTLQDCPRTSPYWSFQSCISCPSSRPYFNLATQLCQNCQEGYKYDVTKKQCVSEKDGSTQP